MNSPSPTQVGPYEVVRTLGQGGMGVVYEVRDPAQPGRRLALKLLLTDDPPQDLLIRFKREAEVLGKIQHPNVIQVVDFDQAEDGKPYLVCEFVAGKTLRELCKDDPMEPEQAARVIRDLSDALGELHKRQILHRDIKPENVMLSEDGEPMLLDFGLAKDLGAERLTVTGSILGTPSYMAPEQAEGSRNVDARTDVYGLGATLFFLLCGRAPFKGRQPMAVLRQVLLDEPVWPTGDDREDQRLRREATQAALTPTPKAAPAIVNAEATVWNPADRPTGFLQAPTQIRPGLAETDVASTSPPGALNPPGSSGFQEDATMLSVPGSPASQFAAPPGGFQEDATLLSAPGGPASQFAAPPGGFQEDATLLSAPGAMVGTPGAPPGGPLDATFYSSPGAMPGTPGAPLGGPLDATFYSSPGGLPNPADGTFVSAPGLVPGAPGQGPPRQGAPGQGASATPVTARFADGTLHSMPGETPTGYGVPNDSFGGMPSAAGTHFGSMPGGMPTGFGSLPGGMPGGAAPTAFGSMPGGMPLGGTPSGFASQPGGPSPAQFGSLPAGAPPSQTPTRTVDVADYSRQDQAAALRAASSVVHAQIDSKIPKALVAITKLAMAKEPDHRYPTTAALRDDLDRYLNSGQAGADSTLRSQRRRVPLLLGGLGLLMLAGAAVYLLQSDGIAPNPTPAVSPSASPSATAGVSPSALASPSALPSPSAAPSPRASALAIGPKPATLQAGVAALPLLGQVDFPKALATARHHYPDAEILKRLGQARVDLDELRKTTSPASRTTLSARWRSDHRQLSPERTGPVALELAPRRFRHNPESAKRQPQAKHLLARQWRFGAYVSWLDEKGTKLAVADSQRFSVWDMSEEIPQRPVVNQDLDKRAWVMSFMIRSFPKQGVAYLVGSTMIPDGKGGVQMARGNEPRRLASFSWLREGEAEIGRLAQGVDAGTDRAISMDLNRDGTWLAAGTERGEVILLELGPEGPTGTVHIERHDEFHTDIQALAFLEGGDLLSLCGMRDEEGSVVRWRLGEGGLKVVSRFPFGRGDPPASLLALSGERVLVGRVGGRLVDLDLSDLSMPKVSRELDSYGLPPFAGAYGKTPWGPLAFVGEGQPRTYKRAQEQHEGGVLHAWRTPTGLESLASYRLSDPLDSFASVSLSPDGTKLAAGTLMGEVLVWELAR